MELLTIKTTINRNTTADPQEISLSFEQCYELPKIILSETETTDLQAFFNAIFNYILKHEKLLQFQLSDTTKDLFNEVAEDVIMQLNSEISQSEQNFEEFIELKKK
ncbi:hypothetical protein AAFA72_000995 [Enterococcus faecalis]|uniref:hypothetical protein n=2 Tax=Enterococcus faecalis TaxID=1351 RepID=UPI001C5C77E4|nr:hypothetical protein [Enterococcus faecalis]HBI1555826.1 hypothetical protein [Enterococcus faecalis]HBI1558889.1 hypothetical protein [Enterococcus faecalis]HBI1567782.1 hypothetical protein [Enterococcus faecalis]